ncbi:hypothetical protein FACS189438_2620 [Bacteroidia bacterium]|nr:hypothetical protein FACS189438_2620 [Bacteroidia bacterium]
MQVGLLSVDYELANYHRMNMYDIDGIANQETNQEIAANFGATGTLRVGGELKVTPQFAIRAGVAQIGNPMKSALKDGNVEVYTVGTIPHYTVENSIINYSAGLGYRFTPNFYMDVACVLKSQKEKLYAFSNLFGVGSTAVESQPATLKSEATRVAITLGYKF